MTVRGDCEWVPQLDEEYCDKEEEYWLIYEYEGEGPTSNLARDHDIPTNSRTSLVSKVRPKGISKCYLSNRTNSNSHDVSRRVPTSSTGD